MIKDSTLENFKKNKQKKENNKNQNCNQWN